MIKQFTLNSSICQEFGVYTGLVYGVLNETPQTIQEINDKLKGFVARRTINNHLRMLINFGYIESQGETNKTKYVKL